MNTTLREAFMRHRVGFSELCILAIGLFAAGFFALTYDLSGSISSEQRVELIELVALGILMMVGIGFFSWRRFAEQEREIGQRVAAEDRARFLAHHDHLTGLRNRRQLQQALNAAVAIPPSAERSHAILLLDLNGFKKVNDVFGHARGDEVLSMVASRMAGVLRERDLLARTGGDEFAMVLREISGTQGAASIADKVIKSLHPPIIVGIDQHHVGTGIGISLIPRDGIDPSELLRKADIALYRAKKSGRDGFAFFQEEMDQEARTRDLLQRELSTAIGTETLVPNYQPVIDLGSGDVRAFEALARWTHPRLGNITPDQFIPIAETSGQIKELTDHLLRRACHDAMNWPAHIMLSFNISPVLLRDQTLGLRILEILSTSGLPPHRLELEITENAIVRDLEWAQHTLGALRDAGIRIALDDFGTGSTSLFHLRSFKFDVIKIDRSFINLMTKENESAQIVKAILGLAKGLGVEIVAEGIEESAQRTMLQDQGCKDGQGFLFGRAIPAAETLEFLTGHPGSGRHVAA